MSQAVAEVVKSGSGLQTARPTGRWGSGADGGDDLDVVGDEAEAVAQVGQGGDDGGSGVGGEDEPHRVVAAADGQRVDLQAGAGGGEGRADLEHVRAEDQLVAGGEVVGVVLHEGGAAGQALRP